MDGPPPRQLAPVTTRIIQDYLLINEPLQPGAHGPKQMYCRARIREPEDNRLLCEKAPRGHVGAERCGITVSSLAFFWLLGMALIASRTTADPDYLSWEKA